MIYSSRINILEDTCCDEIELSTSTELTNFNGLYRKQQYFNDGRSVYVYNDKILYWNEAQTDWVVSHKLFWWMLYGFLRFITLDVYNLSNNCI